MIVFAYAEIFVCIYEFTMPNTQKTAVEIEWILDVPVREDIYEYIVNS